MDMKPDGSNREDMRDTAEALDDDTVVPVIELIDVVKEDAENYSFSGQSPVAEGSRRDALSMKNDLDEALYDVQADRPGMSGHDERRSPAEPYELPIEDFSGLLDVAEEDFTFTGDMDDKNPAAFEGVSLLDEGRLEAMIARIVEDVVGRVTREAVAEATEKVLTAAIEAIRDNLEHPSK